jgi:hypothetical protein
MKRRLPALLALLSLLLALASAGFWARSAYVDDVWVFAPQPVSGSYYHWIAASADGRLVLISRKEYFPDARVTAMAGYQTPPVPASTLDRSALVWAQGGGAAEFQLPDRLLEWASTGYLRYLAVRWQLFVLFFSAGPAVWPLRWLWKRRHVPAFPVVPSIDDPEVVATDM